jgi:glyoxylase I family protein
MPVTGIGGIFFRAKDPKSLSDWYHRHFGIACIDYVPWEQAAGPTVFSPFAETTDYFPAEKQWMINLRVTDIDGLIRDLQAAGIEVITKPEWNSPEIGHFARVHDPEGNPIELWQPA